MWLSKRFNWLNKPKGWPKALKNAQKILWCCRWNKQHNLDCLATRWVDNWKMVQNNKCVCSLFGSNICLSTSPESHITNVPDVPCQVATPVHNYEITEVVTADIKVEYLFPKQHLSINTSSLMTRCQQCSAYCKTAKISSILCAAVSLQDRSGTVTTFLLMTLCYTTSYVC